MGIFKAEHVEERPIEVSVSVFNFGTVEEKKAHALRLKNAGVSVLHIDATPEEKYTPEEIKQFDELDMPMQYHPMFPISVADIEALSNIQNLKTIMFHPTMVENPEQFARDLKQKGFTVFAVIAHDTPNELWQNKDHVIYNPDLVDGILFMTVMYGMSGRGFEHEWMPKLKQIRSMMHPAQKLWCDGSVGEKTIPELLPCGVDGVVSASYLLKAEDPQQAIAALQKYDLAIASDHAGFVRKAELIEYLMKNGKKVRDLGLYRVSFAETDGEYKDYPHYARAVAKEVSKKNSAQGVLVCGSGIGMAISANKIPKVRAAFARNELDAEMARRHNNINVICLGERCTDPDPSFKIVNIFLNTTFDGDTPEGSRHKRRVTKMCGLQD